ncbi:hypothetical protein OKW46_006591 [Paraburkholderia sp. WSM4179]|nr:hypothetical protein [Paraburkholderia sp. WSM4179]
MGCTILCAVGQIAFSIIGRWTIAMTGQYTRVMKQCTEHDRIPAMQAESLISGGRLVALAPGHDLMIDLYRHHWEQEAEPLATISELVMAAARRSLVQPVPGGERVS